MNITAFKLGRLVALATVIIAATSTRSGAAEIAIAEKTTILDSNSSEVTRSERLTNAVTGAVTEVQRKFVTFASGLNYQDEAGVWRESQDLIELTDDGGAAALRGPHKVHFQPNLNVPGAIVLTSSAGRVYRTHVLGLYWFDAKTGQSILIAPVKDSIGELHPPNQVIYPDAFDGVRADVRFTYSKAGFESDVILLEKPAPPEDYGIDSEYARLEVWHEFLEPPVPRTTRRTLSSVQDPSVRKSMAAPDLIEETLDFQDLWFPQGRAFEAGTEPTRGSDSAAEIRLVPQSDTGASIPTGKQWLQIDGRSVLIEAVEWKGLVTAFTNSSDVASVTPHDSRRHSFAQRRLPAAQVATERIATRVFAVASTPYTKKGFVLDYITVNPTGSYTFQTGTTYYITSSGYLSGTTTFQPGCVIKFASNAHLLMYGPIVCNGTSGSPSILTSMHDDLFGETISGSTGVPTYSSDQALWVYYVNWQTMIRYMKIRWAQKGIRYDSNGGDEHDAQSIELQQCQTGIYANNCEISLLGVTKCGVMAPTSGSGAYSFNGTIADACNGDTDSDGLLDSWETTYFGNISSQNGTGDADSDGLSNLGEAQYGTNPTLSDSDSDGLTDGIEVTRGYNPAAFDSNGNGVGDGYEDSDGDGLANLMEGTLGLQPWSFDDLNSNSVGDWKDDTDGDGLSDAYERNISGTSYSVVEPAPTLPVPLLICPLP